jgi:hypothetical protein
VNRKMVLLLEIQLYLIQLLLWLNYHCSSDNREWPRCSKWNSNPWSNCYNGIILHLLIDFKKVNELDREVLYNILTEVVHSWKLFTLLRMCLIENTIKSAEVNICLMHFLFRMVWNKVMQLLTLFFKFTL